MEEKSILILSAAILQRLCSKANWFSPVAPPAFLKTDLVSHSWGQWTNSGMIAFLHTLTVSHLKVIVSYCIRSSYQCLAYGKHLCWIKSCCVNRKAGTTLLYSKQKAENSHSPLCDMVVPLSTVPKVQYLYSSSSAQETRNSKQYNIALLLI